MVLSFETKKVSLKFNNQEKSLEEKEKIKNLLEKLDYLSGKEVYLKEEKKEQIITPEFTITLLNQEEKETKISFFSTKEEFLVLKEEDTVIFSLEKDKYQSIKEEVMARVLK